MRIRNRPQRSLLQLPEELVKHILLLLAMTSDGAKDIARVLVVSKRVMEMAMSAYILRAMSFGQAQLPNTESAWRTNGLILKSARASNPKPYEQIMKKIKVKIDKAYNRLELIMPLLEEWNASVKGRGVLTRSISERIRTEIRRVRRQLLDTNLDIMSTKWRINDFGRQYFQNSDLILLDRFECLQPKFDKCCTLYWLLARRACLCCKSHDSR